LPNKNHNIGEKNRALDLKPCHRLLIDNQQPSTFEGTPTSTTIKHFYYLQIHKSRNNHWSEKKMELKHLLSLKCLFSHFWKISLIFKKLLRTLNGFQNRPQNSPGCVTDADHRCQVLHRPQLVVPVVVDGDEEVPRLGPIL
jgi:hypothetical protein